MSKNTITIDPRDLDSMIEIMDKYHETKTMLPGINEDGERTYASIFEDRIVIETYQKHHWVRKNVYWRDGTREELFDRKWEDLTMNTTEIINLLSQQHLKNVRAKVDKPSLLLIGSHSSPFLRSVNRLAEQVGIDSHILSYLPPLLGNTRVVIDRETYAGVVPLHPEYDVDNLYNPGMSCVAEAAYELLFDSVALEGKTVTIVGRGHAVKGLAEKLIALNATVTVAHSYTKDLYRAMNGQDVVVLATPVVPAFPLANEMVLDIGGTLPKEMVEQLPPGCQYEGRIGKLTNSILLARAAGVYHEI